MKIAVFWDVMLCSLFKFTDICKEYDPSIFRDGAELCLPPASRWLFARHCSKMPVIFYRTTQHNTPEDNTLHSHCCEVLRFRFIDVAALGFLAAQSTLVIHM